MSEALIVQQRHLAIPECALFKPSELVIAKDCSQEDFVRICRAVSVVGNASEMWIADAAAFAVEKWGRKEGPRIAAEATGYAASTLYSSSFVAKSFPPAKRLDGYKYNHYRYIRKFPEAWRDAFLARHQGENLSCRDLLAVALKEYGRDPSKVKSVKKRSVSVCTELYARLHMYAGKRKVAVLISEICEEWLKKQKPLLAPKQRKNATKPGKLRIAFVDCKPDSFIDSEGGKIPYSARSKAATAFRSEAAAISAEEKYAAEKGYRARVVKCPVCSGGNARGPVWHVHFIYPTMGRDGKYYPKLASDAVAQTDGPELAQEKTAQIGAPR